MIINVAEEYTKTPTGRYGELSGEHFRETILKPRFKECKENNDILVINLDGGYGYASCFLDEAFGILARQLKDPDLLNIKIISEDEPKLIDDIKEYVMNGLSLGGTDHDY